MIKSTFLSKYPELRKVHFLIQFRPCHFHSSPQQSPRVTQSSKTSIILRLRKNCQLIYFQKEIKIIVQQKCNHRATQGEDALTQTLVRVGKKKKEGEERMLSCKTILLHQLTSAAQLQLNYHSSMISLQLQNTLIFNLKKLKQQIILTLAQSNIVLYTSKSSNKSLAIKRKKLCF